MMDKDMKKAFKGLTGIVLLLSDDMAITWGKGDEKGLPGNRIFIFRHRASKPDYTFSPCELEKLVYTKPGIFSKGVMTVVCADGRNISYLFKDKSCMKDAEKFNRCLMLYKQYHLEK